MDKTQSQQLYQRAQQVTPGGVNSPIRAFKSVGGNPFFAERGQGAYIFDADGQQYIDYVGSYGPLILGHAHPAVITAVTEAVTQGLSFGVSTAREIQLAESIVHHMPSIEMVRLVNSGTEATATAIRLARGYTGRSKIVKFQGCYHGHVDSLLVKAGSAVLDLGLPESAGIPPEFTQHTLTCQYNDVSALTELFAQYGSDIAGVIVEPIAGNMGMILPQPEFLPAIQALCRQYKSVFIADEVMTGFRVHLGGAQALYAIQPDLTCLGKVIGGGMPIGAVGGRRDLLEALAPLGPVFQAGTLSGNPISVAAGLATLNQLTPSLFIDLEQRSQRVLTELQACAAHHQIPCHITTCGGMFGFVFAAEPPKSYLDMHTASHHLFKLFFQKMLAQGVYFAPSSYEAGFISSAHDDSVIAQTLTCLQNALEELSQAPQVSHD